MCGIVGFNWEDETQIKHLASLLHHRGPEQQGFHVSDGISLGHKRLCILDLSDRAKQPLYNENQTICVCYNGEIYNFQTLRSELEKQGHHFSTKTDTEVLVHGYEQWGIDLLHKLNGQFAFCIFDAPRRILFLARDRLGIKPLYYCHRHNRFIFASELKVFFQCAVPRQISTKALEYYLFFGYTPPGQSILQDVRKLPAGHYLIYDLESNRIQHLEKYWDITYQPYNDLSTAEATRQIRDRLEASVQSRLISDVPLGAFLSGGLDSSIIVGLMRKYVRQLNTFSIRFDVPGYDESSYARIVSERFGTQHHEIQFNAQTVRQLITELPYYYDEPFADPSMIPTCLVCRVAKKYVTVSLSGTGGDELFAGYPRYVQFAYLRRLNQLAGPVRAVLRATILAANKFWSNDKLNKLQGFLSARQQPWQLYTRLFSYMFRSDREDGTAVEKFRFAQDYFRYPDDLSNLLNFDLHEYLPECLLTKEDRASMAVSLEVRVPFLDHGLVEFAATVPPGMKIYRHRKKYILKKAFAKLVPARILHRRKMGFGVPLPYYFRNELRDFAFETIFRTEDCWEYFDRSMVEQLWQRHQSGRADYSRLFWSIMMFNLWHRKWIA